jgi:hypothetical protein
MYRLIATDPVDEIVQAMKAEKVMIAGLGAE